MTPRPRLLATAALIALLVLGGCATAPPGAELAGSEWSAASRVPGTAPDAVWTHQVFGNRKPTQYTPVHHEGRAAVLAYSESGNSTLRLRLSAPEPASGTLAFSWFVTELNPAFDLRERDTSDAVTRVVLVFDGDRSTLSRRDHMLSDLAQLVTGEPMPYATLMYVWDPQLPIGSLVYNAHTRRIRKLVVDSGPEQLGRWVDHERDIEADFRQAFGEAPGRLIGVGVMTDANNTESTARAWYGPIQIKPGVAVTRQR